MKRVSEQLLTFARHQCQRFLGKYQDNAAAIIDVSTSLGSLFLPKGYQGRMYIVSIYPHGIAMPDENSSAAMRLLGDR